MTIDVERLLERAGAAEASGSSFTIARYKTTVFQRRMAELLNHYAETDATGDDTAACEHRAAFEERWPSFVESGAGGHPNPAFALPTMRGLALMTFGRPEEADPYFVAALAGADADWQKAVALHNRGNVAILCRRYDDAVPFAAAAVEIDPRNEGFWANLTIALYHTDREAAARVLRQVPRWTDLNDPSSVWRLCLTEDRDFVEMSGFEPYDDLIEQIEAADLRRDRERAR